MRQLDVARNARRDIDKLLWDSHVRHGARAADRYRRLIDAALADLRHDPSRPTATRFETTTLWLYALRIASRRLAVTHRVGDPPHVVAYRFDEARVRIVRVLHEAMDLPRHLASAARTDDSES